MMVTFRRLHAAALRLPPPPGLTELLALLCTAIKGCA